MTTTENIRKELQTLADPGSKQHSRRTHPPTADNGQRNY